MGNYITTLEMQGFSVTLLRLDEEMTGVGRAGPHPGPALGRLTRTGGGGGGALTHRRPPPAVAPRRIDGPTIPPWQRLEVPMQRTLEAWLRLAQARVHERAAEAHRTGPGRSATVITAST